MTELTGTAGNDVLDGTPGDDVLHGLQGNDTLNGGGGNDKLYGDEGDDILNGGDGSDTLYLTDGADTADGGSGTDAIEINYSRAAAGILVDLRALWSGGVGHVAGGTVVNVEALNYLETTNFADTVFTGEISTAGLFYGNGVFLDGGDDVATGGSLDDTFHGGLGNDTLNGGGGNDKLYGDEGDDILNGGDGSDTLYLTDGADTADGGSGTDAIEINYSRAAAGILVDLRALWSGGVGHVAGGTVVNVEALNYLETTNFADTVFTGEISTAGLFYGNGVFLDGGDDVATGGSLDDTFHGGLGNDTLNGGGGNDKLYGDEGDDILNGGDGSDTLYLTDGADTADGGSGTDAIEINYSRAAAGILVDLRALWSGGVGHVAGGTVVNVEALNYLETTNFADTVFTGEISTAGLFYGNGVFLDGGDDVATGGSLDDTFHGGLGNDTLNGGGGNDKLYGDEGDDILNGGDGNDRAYYSGPSVSYTITTDNSGVTRIVDNRAGSPDGTDTLRNVEFAQFSDRAVRLVTNIAPVATNDSFTVVGGHVLTLTPAQLLTNDSDADGDTLSVVVATNPAHGTLTLDADGSYRYTPDAAFVGTDSFTYTASDGAAASNVATVSITVSAPPRDAVSVTFSTAVTTGQTGLATITYAHTGSVGHAPGIILTKATGALIADGLTGHLAGSSLLFVPGSTTSNDVSFSVPALVVAPPGTTRDDLGHAGRPDDGDRLVLAQGFAPAADALRRRMGPRLCRLHRLGRIHRGIAHGGAGARRRRLPVVRNRDRQRREAAELRARAGGRFRLARRALDERQPRDRMDELCRSWPSPRERRLDDA